VYRAAEDIGSGVHWFDVRLRRCTVGQIMRELAKMKFTDCTAHHVTVRYCTLLYVTVHYCTLLYVTVRYCTLLYITVRYCTLHNVNLFSVNNINMQSAGVEETT
jgi:hypothetical protein